MLTHAPAEALESAVRIAILSAGRLLQAGSADDVYRRPVNLAAARALGAVNVFARSALPPGWQALAAGAGDQLGFRPEGVRLDPASPARFVVTARRTTGPLIRLTLEGAGLTVNALVPHGAALAIGAETGVNLDPALTFTFASDRT